MAKLDPAMMTLQPVVHHSEDAAFGDATLGLEVGDEIFVGTFRPDRLFLGQIGIHATMRQ